MEVNILADKQNLARFLADAEKHLREARTAKTNWQNAQDPKARQEYAQAYTTKLHMCITSLNGLPPEVKALPRWTELYNEAQSLL